MEHHAQKETSASTNPYVDGFPDREPYQPNPNLHPAAHEYIPKYLFKGFQDPSGLSDVKIRDSFYGERRKLRIALLGAGISAMNFLHFLFEHLKKQAGGMESVEVVVYERNCDVGGVWLTSKYPGCRCDIPSILYQFSWRKRIWSEMYAPAAENLEYLRETAREEGFYDFIKLKHEILQAEWTDEEAKWTLNVRNIENGSIFEDKVDIFCELNGPVSNPRLSDLPGLQEFKGTVVHPANWPQDLDLRDRKVALVGYGCSGVQIAPSIIDDVSKLYTWYRNPTYILPPPYQGTFSGPKGANFKYSDEQKELLKDPDVYLTYRKAVEDVFYKRYSYTINGSPMADTVETAIKIHMREQLKNHPDLAEKIIPKTFGVGCRRQAFGYGYMEAITSPKTTIFRDVPQHFTASGILDANGQEHDLDIVIAATGYDQSHMPRYPKLVNGLDMRPLFAKEPSPPSYMAVMLRHMPNYFNPSSAYGPLPQGNYFQSSETFAKYIIKVLDKMQVERIVSVRPKDHAVNQWVRHANAYLKRTAVTGPCVAWYKGNDGVSRPPALWPGARLQFLKVMEFPRFEDFEIRYEDEDGEDMFGYLGNGWTLDWDAGGEGVDRMWYHGKPERDVDKEILKRLAGTDESVKELTSGAIAARET
jgi:cation diffusion facilitator CzcD-associated flavoprotein CzcO